MLGEEQEKEGGKITEFLPQMQIPTSLLLSPLEYLVLSETKTEASSHSPAGKPPPVLSGKHGQNLVKACLEACRFFIDPQIQKASGNFAQITEIY